MDSLLKLLREGSYILVEEVDEMAQRKLYRETIGKKNPRPNVSLDPTRELLIEDAQAQNLEHSNRASTHSFFLVAAPVETRVSQERRASGAPSMQQQIQRGQPAP